MTDCNFFPSNTMNNIENNARCNFSGLVILRGRRLTTDVHQYNYWTTRGVSKGTIQVSHNCNKTIGFARIQTRQSDNDRLIAL